MSELAPRATTWGLVFDPLLTAPRPALNHLGQRRRRIEAAELVTAPWCFPQGAVVRSRLVEAFAAKGLNVPRQVVTTNSIQVITALLATGRFLAVLSGSTLRLSGRRLGVNAVPADLPIRSGPVGVITLKNRTRSPIAELFIDAAREVTKPLAREPAGKNSACGT